MGVIHTAGNFLHQILFSGLVLLTLCACSTGSVVPVHPENRSQQKKVDAIQRILDEELANNSRLPGILLTARAGQFQWSWASGRFSEGGRQLQPTDLFRSASVTKTFVAAAILKRVEQYALRLDQAISSLLSLESVRALAKGGYQVDEIRLGQLLNHTAGLYNYTDTDSFNQRIFDQPGYRWTAGEQLRLAMEEGSPLNEPGQQYHYSDTHYLLLGEVLEKSTGLPLAQALRTLISYESLGLQDTWLESLEPEPPGASRRISHPLYGNTDTRHWDPSWDLYGSGGLVSSTRDLVTFLDALFRGEIFQKKGTLETMIAVPIAGIGRYYGADGGMGINRVIIYGVTCYGGYGFFGSEVVHCPSLDLTFAQTRNQALPGAGYSSTPFNNRIVSILLQ